MTTKLVLDFSEFNEAVKECLSSQQGVDVITAAARKVSGDQSLVLTKEQRQQCKQAAYYTLYGGTMQSYLK